MAKCRYPNEVCGNMTVLNRETYCDSVPCSLRDETPKQTNSDRIRSMSDEELAEFLSNFAWDNEPTKKETYEWLQSEVEV